MKMRNAAVAADRIDYRIHRRVVPSAPRSNVNPALDRNAALTAIGRSLRDQYERSQRPSPRISLHSSNGSKRSDPRPTPSRNGGFRQDWRGE
jgi:hypothetical protein